MKMRRTVALALVALIAMTAVLADFDSDIKYPTYRSNTFEPYALMSPRVVGMGGAGMALSGTMESRMMNPANNSGFFGLSLPYLSVSVYNIRNNLDYMKEILDANGAVSLYDAAFSLLNSIPGGERNFMSVDIGAGVSIRHISFFGFMNADIFTFGPGDISSTFGVDLDYGFNTALSYQYDWKSGYSLSVGIGVSGLFKNITADEGHLNGIGVGFVSNIFEEYQNDPTDITSALFDALLAIPISMGEAYPVSIGGRVDFPYGFSLALALNNINGNFNMRVLDLEGNDTGVSYTISTPMSLDFGFAWNLDGGKLCYHLFNPSIAFDIIDIIGMFKEGIFEKGVLVDHMKMGAELNLLTVLNARVGLDRGYFTFGVGVDFYALTVDLSYGVRPYGPSREGRYLDYVKLRMNLGYDKP